MATAITLIVSQLYLAFGEFSGTLLRYGLEENTLGVAASRHAQSPQQPFGEENDAMTVRFCCASKDGAPAVAALVHRAYRGPDSRAGWTTEADLLDDDRIDAAQVAGKITDPDMKKSVTGIAGPVVLCPPALLDRAAHYLEAAALVVQHDGVVPDDFDLPTPTNWPTPSTDAGALRYYAEGS